MVIMGLWAFTSPEALAAGANYHITGKRDQPVNYTSDPNCLSWGWFLHFHLMEMASSGDIVFLLFDFGMNLMIFYFFSGL